MCLIHVPPCDVTRPLFSVVTPGLSCILPMQNCTVRKCISMSCCCFTGLSFLANGSHIQFVIIIWEGKQQETHTHHTQMETVDLHDKHNTAAWPIITVRLHIISVIWPDICSLIDFLSAFRSQMHTITIRVPQVIYFAHQRSWARSAAVQAGRCSSPVLGSLWPEKPAG